MTGLMPLRKILLTLCFVFALCAVSSASRAEPPLDAVETMLQAAAQSGQTSMRTVLNAALASWPDDRVAILRMASTVQPGWLSLAEQEEVEQADDAVFAEEARQRARGIFYYLDPTLWNGKIEVGGSSSTGDTSERSGAASLHLDRAFNDTWFHTFDFLVDFARQQGTTSRERYVGSYDVRYQPYEKLFYSNFARIEADQFSGFDYRFVDTIGLGYELFSNATHTLSAEIGGGVRINKLADTSETVTEYLTRLSATYDLQLTDGASVSNTASVLYGTRTTTFENNLSLSTRINAHLAARLSFGVAYESDAPVGTSAWDTITRISLAYDF